MIAAAPLPKSEELYPGFRLCHLLGRGETSEVWEATKDDGTVVALKFLPCADSLTAAQGIRSMQLIRQVGHHQLTQIDKVWCGPNCLVVTMEMAEGSLLDLLTAYRTELGTPIAPEHVCLLLTQVAEVLDFLNTRQHQVRGRPMGIQHGNIKPSNLLVFDDTVKLSDFALASALTCSLEPHSPLGVSPYTAPEVLQGRISDWTDQFGLAVSYCLLRGGQLPFPDTPTRLQGYYVRSHPDLSMLPVAEQTIIRRALAPIPHDRWPSCRELFLQLEKVVC